MELVERLQEFSEKKFRVDYDSSFLSYLDSIKDDNFRRYLANYNGGFYYSGSVHIYGACQEPSYHNIEYINKLMNEKFNNLCNGLLFFGCDVFGNQFAFSDNGIIFFNVETGEREEIAKDFLDWIDVLLNDSDYYSGESLLLKWKKSRHEILLHNQFLVPKQPFALSGTYEVDNLYPNDFEKSLGFYADLARQLKDLPEGTKVNIKIT